VSLCECTGRCRPLPPPEAAEAPHFDFFGSMWRDLDALKHGGLPFGQLFGDPSKDWRQPAPVAAVTVPLPRERPPDCEISSTGDCHTLRDDMPSVEGPPPAPVVAEGAVWILMVASTKDYTTGGAYTSKAACEKAAEATAHAGSYCVRRPPPRSRQQR